MDSNNGLEQTSWNSNGSTDCGGMCWNLLEFHHLLESIALPEFHCAGLCWIPSMEVLEHAGTALRWNSQAGIQHDQFSDVMARATLSLCRSVLCELICAVIFGPFRKLHFAFLDITSQAGSIHEH